MGVRAFWAPSGDEVVFGSTRDGQQNIYLKPVDGARMVVSIATEPSLRLGRPQRLFEDRYIRSGYPWTTYDVAPDGSRLLMLQTRAGTAAPQEIAVVLNWFEALKQLVP